MTIELKLKSQLFKINKNIGFAHIIPDTPVLHDNSLTKSGFTKSYQSSPTDINFSILLSHANT